MSSELLTWSLTYENELLMWQHLTHTYSLLPLLRVLQVNFVLGTGLLCLFTQASLTGRDQALLVKMWSDRMGALYRKMKTTGGRCSGYFLEQAKEDIRQQVQQALCDGKPPEEQAEGILKTLERNYDWLRWAVMVHPATAAWKEDETVVTAAPAAGEEAPQETPETGEEVEGGEEKEPNTSNTPSTSTTTVAPPNNFLSVRPSGPSPPSPHVVACYRDTPSSLDKARIHQLIVDLEWKIPNPPPEVYAALEDEPEKARLYLASRMLRKLREGLGAGVAVHVVPGKMEMRCNFPQASYYLYEYKHRLASGTVCVFG